MNAPHVFYSAAGDKGERLDAMRVSKNDIILLATLCAVGILGCAVQRLQGNTGGNSVNIYCDGELIGQYDIDKSATVPIETSYGRNILTIDDGNAYVSEADCSGGECMAMRIEKGGAGLIVCVPHKLVIKCEQRTGVGIDAVAK